MGICDFQGPQNSGDIALFETLRHWIRRRENFLELLQGALFGLWEPEVNYYHFNEIPGDENRIKVILQLRERWSRAVGDDSAANVG